MRNVSFGIRLRSFLPSASGAFRFARDMIAPPSCMACHFPALESGGLCPSCWSEARFIERPYCEVLGWPFGRDYGDGVISPQALAEPPSFERLRSVMSYGSVARRLASGLKFGDRTELAPFMASWMRRAGAELISESDMVIPVPLHRTRLLSRRYNQSAELARFIASGAGLEYEPLALIRHRRTPKQVGGNRAARLRNVVGAFRVVPQMEFSVRGRSVLLVDDVYTTGATMNACARALKRAGAAKVNALAFASLIPFAMLTQ